jgi:hypothetical protein
MPVNKVKGGYRWGKTGKIYKTKEEAERQGRAVRATMASKGKGKGKSKPKPKGKSKGYYK